MEKRLVFSVLILILLISFSAIAAGNDLWEPNLNFEGKLGDGEITGKGGIVYPLKTEEDSMFYTDFRTMFSNGNLYECNLGLGYRKIFEEKNLLAGGYIFRDYRNQYNNDWNQWTIGGELLTEDVDFRVNYYFPIEDRVLATNVPADEILVVGNEVIYQQATLDTYYETMGGYDLEIGKRFTENLPVDIGVYLRTFKFSNDSTEDIDGKGIKVDTKFGDPDEVLWTAGIDWQEDTVRGSNFEIVLGLSTPLGKSTTGNKLANKSKLEQRMVEAPKRDIDIILSESKAVKKVISEEEAVDPENGETVNKVWYVTANGSGDGTKDNPADLNQLFSSENSLGLAANDIIVLLGDEGEIDVGTLGSLQLDSGHKLLSPGGYTVLNSSLDSSRNAQFKPTGMQATLVNSQQENDIVVLADNTTVSGVNFTGEDGNNQTAIYGNNLSGEIKINNNIIDNAYNAIDISAGTIMPAVEGNISGGNNIIVEENTLDNIDSEGIEIYADSDTENNISVNNNQIYYTGDSAIYINSQALNDSNVDVHENYIEETGENGIFVFSAANSGGYRSSHVNITGNVIDKSSYSGIYVDALSETDSIVNVSDNILDNSGSTIYYNSVSIMKRLPEGAIAIDNRAEDNAINTVENNTIIKSTGGGILVDSEAVNDSTVDVHNNYIEEAGASGIFVCSETSSYVDESSHVNVIGNIIERSSDNGIFVDASSETDSIVNISDNKLNNIGGNIVPGVKGVGSRSEGAITVLNEAQNNIINVVEDNIINNSSVGGIYVSSGDYYPIFSSASIESQFEPEMVNIETTIKDNKLGDILGEGILVMLPYLPVELTQEINIENNIIDFTSSTGIAVGNIYYYSNELLNDSIEKSINVNINNNQIKESFTNGINVFSGTGDPIDAVLTENEILEAGNYGIVFGANVAEVRIYDPVSGYNYYYYPSTLNALAQNNTIEAAVDGGILIYTELREDLEPVLEGIVNVDGEMLETENIFGSGVNPLVDYRDNLYLEDN